MYKNNVLANVNIGVGMKLYSISSWRYVKNELERVGLVGRELLRSTKVCLNLLEGSEIYTLEQIIKWLIVGMPTLRATEVLRLTTPEPYKPLDFDKGKGKCKKRFKAWYKKR